MPSSDSSRRLCRPPASPGVWHPLARPREVSHVPTAQISAMPRSPTPPRSPHPRLYRSKVGHWRGSCSAPFPMPSFRTVLEVLPHTALPQAVDQTHSTVPQVLVPGPSDLRGSAALPALAVVGSRTWLEALRYGRLCCPTDPRYHYGLLRLPPGTPPLPGPRLSASPAPGAP